MKTMMLPAIAALALHGPCGEEAATPTADAPTAATEAAAPAVDDDNDAAEPIENAEEHGHEHDGEDADHAH